MPQLLLRRLTALICLSTCQNWRLVDGFQIVTHEGLLKYQRSITRCRQSQVLALQHSWRGKTTFQQYERRSVVCQAFKVPLIDPSDTWGNIATLCFSASLAQILGTTTAVGKLLGPPVTAMALSFLFASMGISNPGGTQASKWLQTISLSFATPLMLLGADLQDCVARCGPLLPSFIAASIATVASGIFGWFAAGPMLLPALGRDGVIIAAALMAKNIGGGINYIAVCRCLSASPQAIAAGLVVDNIFALVYFPATSALSAGRPDLIDSPRGLVNSCVKSAEETKDTSITSASQSVFQTCNLLFLSTALLWLGERIGGATGALPCCTTLSLLFALLAPKRWMAQLQRPAEILGTVCLYLFFATAGAPGIAIANSVRSALAPLALFLSCLYVLHFLILWVLHQIFKTLPPFVPQRLLVASSAAIGGPATAVALAKQNNWGSLVVPSLLIGNMGYAIATFAGLGFARFFGGPTFL